MSSLLALAYAAVAAAAGVVGMLLLVAATAGALDRIWSAVADWPTAGRAAADLVLLSLFALQHSGMARRWYKQTWERRWPSWPRRSTYVLASGLVLGLVVLAWQPVPGILWEARHPGLRLLLWALWAAAWVYAVVAVFAISHADLFGLRQVQAHRRGQSPGPLPFSENGPYAYSRHPLMLGVLVGLWAAPTLSASRALLAGFSTLYLMGGIWLEERDQLLQRGEVFADYRRRVGVFWTLSRARRQRGAAGPEGNQPPHG